MTSTLPEAKYCPICGSDDLTYSDPEHHYFKCNKCEKWFGVGEYEYWEVNYIVQKLQSMKRAMEKLKEANE